MIKIVVVCLLVVCLFACESNEKRAQVKIGTKDGESCLIEHKCKIIVKRWEEGTFPQSGGNVYYRCIVNDSFYNTVKIEDTVIMNISTDCEKINP